MKKNYKVAVIAVVVTIFFIMFGFFYDKSNKNNNEKVITYDRYKNYIFYLLTR